MLELVMKPDAKVNEAVISSMLLFARRMRALPALVLHAGGQYSHLQISEEETKHLKHLILLPILLDLCGLHSRCSGKNV
jgi:hypothetical protein